MRGDRSCAVGIEDMHSDTVEGDVRFALPFGVEV
jgi:hypothetical protein